MHFDFSLKTMAKLILRRTTGTAISGLFREAKRLKELCGSLWPQRLHMGWWWKEGKGQRKVDQMTLFFPMGKRKYFH